MRTTEIISGIYALKLSTHGLAAILGKEISASVKYTELADECKKMLLFVAEYVEKGNVIEPGEKFSYGYWVTQVADAGRRQACLL